MADPPTSLLDEEKDVSDDLPSNILPTRDPLTRALSEESDVVEFDVSFVRIFRSKTTIIFKKFPVINQINSTIQDIFVY